VDPRDQVGRCPDQTLLGRLVHIYAVRLGERIPPQYAAGLSSCEMETCPYSAPPYEKFTDDHIFPQFLGGRRTVRVCKQCNDVFGHSFEGRASQQLKRLQVFISDFGLDLTRTPAAWPAAIVIGDETYDLRPGLQGAQYFLSKPTFIKDEDGKLVGGKARSMSEAKQITGDLIRAGKAKEVEIFTSQGATIENTRLTGSFSFNDDLYRLATKMAAALLVAFDRTPIITESDIPAYLHGKTRLPVSPAYCDVEPIRTMRPALSHTIYVELGPVSYAMVLIFGFLKIFLPLPAAGHAEAFLGSLDPITGDETFDAVACIGPRSVPQSILPHEALAQFRDMQDALTRESVARGATRPPKLETTHLDMGAPVEPAWNSTIRYMFPGTPKRET